MTDSKIEEMIQEKGLTAPRVTPETIQELMKTVRYATHKIVGTTTTVATAILPMGDEFFTLATEYSACASPENFDEEIGATIACQNAQYQAEQMLWILEGYALKKELTAGEKT